MEDNLPVEISAPRPFDWGSGAQLGLGLLALLVMWGCVGLTALLMLFGLTTGASGDVLTLSMVAVGLFASSFVLLPVIYYALRRIQARPGLDGLALIRRTRPMLWIVALPVVIGLGYLVGLFPAIAWILLPPLHLLAVSIPVGWLCYLAVRGLPLGSSQRAFGVFAAGALLGPLLLMIVELGLALVGMILLVVYLMARPDLVNELQALALSLQNIGPQDQEAMLEAMLPYAQNTGVLLAALTFVAGLVPLVEEAIKPIGVWLLAGKRLSPRAGFVAGAISGAGYAFMESLLLASGGGGDQWAVVVAVRVGTSAMHILNTALVGYGLVSAWQARRYGTLALMYLLAVGMHALWNGATVYMAFNSLSQGLDGAATAPGAVSAAMSGVLALLAMGVFVALQAINRHLATKK